MHFNQFAIYFANKIVAQEERKGNKKCKSKAKPSEKVLEDEELAGDSFKSDYFDCIAVDSA